jgi:putative SOS response-associated peptidase YedK
MFQRYSGGWGAEVFGETFGIEPVHFDNYNVAPTRNAPIVRSTKEGGQILNARWGLIPRWVKDPFNYSGDRKLINADVKELTEKPTPKRLHEEGQRCLVPALGFYQWEEEGDKQPYFVRRSDGGLLVFAGLYDHWKNDKDEIYSFCVVTTTSEMSSGDDDAPVILEPEDFDLWLEGKSGEAEELLRPFGGDLEVYKVDGRVAKPRENDAALTERIVR